MRTLSRGEAGGNTGIFPSSFVRIISSFPGDTPGLGGDSTAYTRAQETSGHEYDNTRSDSAENCGKFSFSIMKSAILIIAGCKSQWTCNVVLSAPIFGICASFYEIFQQINCCC